MLRRAFFCVLVWMLLSSVSVANSVYVPQALEPWVDWVLHEEENRNCPFYHAAYKQRHCGWPGQLKLTADDNGLQFEQNWQVFARSWVPLPGSDGFWPQQVWINEDPALIVSRNGFPVVQLDAGYYSLRGVIPWQDIPDSLRVPPETALLRLQLNKNAIELPNVDPDGRLWFSQKQSESVVDDRKSGIEDKLSIRVYRHLIDDIPFQMKTHIELEVSGNPREMLLGKVLFENYQVGDFITPLPARLEDDGRLRVQLRPGQWRMQIDSYFSDPVNKVFLENVDEAIWPEEEIWVFQSVPELRQVRVEGVESIDPNQTVLPDDLKQWPAFPMKAGQAMMFKQLRRGDPQPSPNQLTNQRDLWLDFDGGGLTVRDSLSGVLHRDWRLNVNSELALGNLVLNGRPQVITKVKDLVGVEVRSGALSSVALSRLATIDSSHGFSVSSTGWLHDFDSLRANLHLPAGWRVLMVSGADHASDTWTGNWSVWDIFVVMISIAAILRLRGLLAAIVSGLALVLIYPEAPTFLYLLLNVVAVMALLSLLPNGRLRGFCRVYALGAALALILWLMGFMVEQARFGLYPQLQQPWQKMGASTLHYSAPDSDLVTMPMASMALEQMSTMAEDAAEPRSKSKYKQLRAVRASGSTQPEFEQFDPALAAQTGPGLPNWQWQRTELHWSGPVTQEEKLNVWLLRPLENRLLCWVRVLLSALLVFSVLGLTRKDGSWSIAFDRVRGMSAAAMVFALGFCFSLMPNQSFADVPSPEVLQELQKRITEDSNCSPNCFSITQTQLNLEKGRLTLLFQVHALQMVFWDLPGSQGQWRVDSILLDGEEHTLRKFQNKKQVHVPAGLHDVVVSGRVDREKAFQLNFKSPVHNVHLNVSDFVVKGVENNRLLSSSMNFYPTKKSSVVKEKTAKILAPNPIAGFVKIERDIRLGLNWYMETRIIRVAPKVGSIPLEIPLLEGESVTSQSIDIDQGTAKVTLESGKNQLVWFSSLSKSSLIQLQALQTSQWVEHWIVNPSPLWNLESDGIAPIKTNGQVSQWRPQWRPYPGETVTLNISRPQAVVGVTKTLDQIQQEWQPGQRESQSKLRIHLSSSKGAEQRIRLPDGARVKQVMVDDQQRSVDETNPNLVVSINPGEHWLEVNWSQPNGITTKSHTPVVGVDGPYVNHSIEVKVPRDRWVLFVGGPDMGPAILFWGVLCVMILVAIALGWVTSLPLKSWHWVLLVVGLSAGWIEAIVPIVGWFYLMEKRSSDWSNTLNRVQFNVMQVFLAGFSIFTFMLLVGSIPNGLLGSPDMGIVGNGSSLYALNWFVDRGNSDLQSAWFISLPLWVYRAIMLVWSLWLSVYLLRWLKWGWQCFTAEGYWRSNSSIEKGS